MTLTFWRIKTMIHPLRMVRQTHKEGGREGGREGGIDYDTPPEDGEADSQGRREGGRDS